eukprot:4125702-Pyramimonas_sp.AAC.2
MAARPFITSLVRCRAPNPEVTDAYRRNQIVIYPSFPGARRLQGAFGLSLVIIPSLEPFTILNLSSLIWRPLAAATQLHFTPLL